ncbi:PE-PPE domain-containing protein [Mycolicibacterium sp. P9-22]|uniref:PE-PPE domain-containing protein n=1 Tax=Mycolicibacterium sp. P9-22 TaxID=2024613 RepID=UPI0011EEEDBE|nr:PE-PPE domain-containing protein [Mycolicibacterium sp. P9-22]KAA0118544.1 PE-PPE domain-containing protein [Mycolicibacterium sp. P9-22]
MSARHRVKKRSRAAGVVAVPAVAALLAAGMVEQPLSAPAPIAVHQQHRVVSDQEVALAALALFAVPGAGVQFPPGALDTQDGGIWRRIEDLTVLNDPTRYPGTVTAASVDAGATWLTELILARDPSTTVSGINTGSFGGRVAAEALNRVAATGYDMSSVFGVFYGDSNTPGTGIFARYGPDEPTFGSDVLGGAIQLPDGTYLRINREYDPIAYFPKYLFNPMSWIQLAAGFVFEHSRLQDFDFEDPENVVTVDGNVVTVRVNSPVMPLLMPLKILGAPQRIIDAFQAILQPMVESTGMYETGKVGFLPSPQKLFQQLQAVAAGFEKASQILAGNYPEPEEPGEPPVITAPDTTTEIIDAMEDRDEELNGAPAPAARVAIATAQAPLAEPEVAVDVVPGESAIDELSAVLEPEETIEAEAPSEPVRRIRLTEPRSAKVAPRTAGTSSP